MFSLGQDVWIKSKELKGTVIYTEDDYLEVELENGSEVGFSNTSDLELYTNQVPTPKKRGPTWAEIFQQNLERD